MSTARGLKAVVAIGAAGRAGRRWQVQAPDPDASYGPGDLMLAGGVGYTDNLAVVAYCRAAGYGVRDRQAPPSSPLSEDERNEAQRRGISTDVDPAAVRDVLATPLIPHHHTEETAS